ncbi:tRNA (adenosine(37)-N6)-dimethylallyltransferase MiaA [Marivita sp. S0852]|uniref:tRNA (adenosine(37)-N6)-dimethylallyltransferase MiaA n=1 Tax=Marivita sp. S0852 TaxID=3373893 RepID=UPI003982A838
MDISKLISGLSPTTPVLIAGPTASGKSDLALRIAEQQGGIVINADAIQVYADWRILTARPSVQDEARAPHVLYGHVARDVVYSVGDWLRDLEPYLDAGPRPIIVGGTGLYFTALTQGLARIPETPDAVRAEATARITDHGHRSLIPDLDADTRSRIDLENPMRVQRAWEVLRSTGTGLAAWQDATPPPRLSLADVQAFVVDAPKDWLTPRIEHRFARMITAGALDEARANKEGWTPDLPSSKAIGAAELMAVLDGHMIIEQASERASILTRQFAKRQRTWFRSRMGHWTWLEAAELEVAIT